MGAPIAARRFVRSVVEQSDLERLAGVAEILTSELVTNSLKHAFPDGGGEIAVNLSRTDGGELLLVVADNGKGYDGRPPGPGASKVALGSTIIKGLVAQLEGTIMVESKPGLTRSEIRVAAPQAGCMTGPVAGSLTSQVAA